MLRKCNIRISHSRKGMGFPYLVYKKFTCGSSSARSVISVWVFNNSCITSLQSCMNYTESNIGGIFTCGSSSARSVISVWVFNNSCITPLQSCMNYTESNIGGIFTCGSSSARSVISVRVSTIAASHHFSPA